MKERQGIFQRGLLVRFLRYPCMGNHTFLERHVTPPLRSIIPDRTAERREIVTWSNGDEWSPSPIGLLGRDSVPPNRKVTYTMLGEARKSNRPGLYDWPAMRVPGGRIGRPRRSRQRTRADRKYLSQRLTAHCRTAWVGPALHHVRGRCTGSKAPRVIPFDVRQVRPRVLLSLAACNPRGKVPLPVNGRWNRFP